MKWANFKQVINCLHIHVFHDGTLSRRSHVRLFAAWLTGLGKNWLADAREEFHHLLQPYESHTSASLVPSSIYVIHFPIAYYRTWLCERMSRNRLPLIEKKFSISYPSFSASYLQGRFCSRRSGTRAKTDNGNFLHNVQKKIVYAIKLGKRKPSQWWDYKVQWDIQSFFVPVTLCSFWYPEWAFQLIVLQWHSHINLRTISPRSDTNTLRNRFAIGNGCLSLLECNLIPHHARLSKMTFFWRLGRDDLCVQPSYQVPAPDWITYINPQSLVLSGNLSLPGKNQYVTSPVRDFIAKPD